jgi:hypothetical protein
MLIVHVLVLDRVQVHLLSHEHELKQVNEHALEHEHEHANQPLHVHVHGHGHVPEHVRVHVQIHFMYMYSYMQKLNYMIMYGTTLEVEKFGIPHIENPEFHGFS